MPPVAEPIEAESSVAVKANASQAGSRDLGGRVFLGTSANALGLILTFGQHIVLVPLFLAYWGTELYGDWLVLTAVVGYLSLLDGGFQTYVVNRMNATWAVGDRRAFHELLHTGLALYLGVVGVGVALVGLLAWLTPWPRFLGLAVTSSTTSTGIVILAGSALLVAIPGGLVGGIYRCMGENARGVTLGNLGRFLYIFGTAIALWAGGGLLTIAFLMLLTPMFVASLAFADITRRHPEVRFGMGRASRSVLRESIRPSLYFLLLPMSQALWVQGTLVVLSSLMGSSVLVLYTTTRTMFMFVSQARSQITNAIWPEVTALFAITDLARLRRLHRFTSFLSVIGSGLACGYLLVFGAKILEVWTSGRVDGDLTLLCLFGAYVLVGSVWQISQVIPLATNRHREVSLRYLGSAITAVILSLLSVPLLGLYGAAAALLVGDALFLSIPVLKQACHLTQDKHRMLLAELCGRGLLGLTVGLALAFGAFQFVGVQSIWQFFTGTAVCAATMFAALILLLGPAERQLAVNWTRFCKIGARGWRYDS